MYIHAQKSSSLLFCLGEGGREVKESHSKSVNGVGWLPSAPALPSFLLPANLRGDLIPATLLLSAGAHGVDVEGRSVLLHEQQDLGLVPASAEVKRRIGVYFVWIERLRRDMGATRGRKRRATASIRSLNDRLYAPVGRAFVAVLGNEGGRVNGKRKRGMSGRATVLTWGGQTGKKPMMMRCLGVRQSEKHTNSKYPRTNVTQR